MSRRLDEARLRAVRLELGLTQAQAAAELGIDIRTYRRYESGEVNDPARGFDLLRASRKRIVEAICDRFGMDRDELLVPLVAGAPTSRPPSERDLELRRARVAQQQMLPSIPEIPGLAVGTLYEPCREVGGDFFDLFVVGPHHIGVVIGDVSGHGIDAALVMAMAKKSIQLHAQGRFSPHQALCAANADLLGELPRQTFVTVGYGILDLRDGGFRFVRAGHLPLIHLSASSSSPEALKPAGLPLGAFPPSHFGKGLEEVHLELAAGDTLVWTTDGVAEATTPEGEPLGWERLVQVVGGSSSDAADQAVARIRDSLDDLLAGHPAEDDCTVLAVRFEAPCLEPLPSPAAASRAALTNLRPDGLPVFGRQREVETLAEWLLEPGCGIVTLRGPGGIGKTTLARSCGRTLLDRLPGGVWFVDLIEATSGTDLALAVANALGVQVSGPQPERTVANVLEFRRPLVLILDNFEQLIDAGAPVLETWRAAAPQAKLLVTSRFALGLREERGFVLEPLPAPPQRHDRLGPEAVAGFDSVQLFLDRARRADPGFVIDESNAAAVAAICEGLDGLPLAIELAAARVLALTPQQIVDRLERKLRLLASSDRDRPARHRTLKASIDFSYELLAEEEKRAFLSFSVFRGGATLDAVEEVLGVDDIEPLDVVQSLCARSLLRAHDTAGEKRYSVFPVLREYAAERLARGDEGLSVSELHRRHASHYARACEALSDRISSKQHLEVLDALERELENLGAGCDRMIEAGNGDLAAALILNEEALLERRPRSADAYDERLERVLALLDPDANRQLRLRVLAAIGVRLVRSKQSRAEAVVGEALDLIDAQTPAKVRRMIWAMRAWMLSGSGRRAESLEAIDHALAAAESDDLPFDQALMRSMRARMRLAAGVGSEAEVFETVEACARVYEESGDLSSAARNFNILGAVHAQSGDLPRATVHLERAISLLERTGANACFEHINLATTYSLAGDIDAAEKHFRVAETAAREVGNKYYVLRLHLFRATVLGQYPDRRGSFDEDLDIAESLARSLGANADLGQALEYRAKDSWLQGARETGAELLEEAETADHLGESGRPAQSIERNALLALFRATAGQLARASSALAAARATTGSPDQVTVFVQELLAHAAARLAHAEGDGATSELYAEEARRMQDQQEASPPSDFAFAVDKQARLLEILDVARSDIGSERV